MLPARRAAPGGGRICPHARSGRIVRRILTERGKVVTLPNAAGTPGRLTPQRQAVLEVLRDSRDHPTVAELLARVRDRAPGIGAATVYRSLAFLVAAGQALELRFDGAAARYDANMHHHAHLICDGCGQVHDVAVPLAALPRPVQQAAVASGFLATSFDLRVRGRCPGCRGSAPEPHRP